MDLLTIILIAVGLSMDALAVSITNGIMLKEVKLKDALKLGGFFGFFQAVMPFIGWLAGIKFQSYITEIDHWIAFLLLGIIGSKMIYDSVESKKEDGLCKKDREYVLDNKTLFMLAIATSIDALAVGVSFAFLNVSILQSIAVIGSITFFICFAGVFIGKQCGPFLKNYSELVGGSILILIGLKIFMEHTNSAFLLEIFK